jgi:hypothetical protein
MSDMSSKDNANQTLAPGRIMVRAKDIVPEIGDQMAYSPWWVRVRRVIANFMAGDPKRARECPNDATNTALPISIDIFEQLQCAQAQMENRGYGSCLQDPVRYCTNVDHLIRRARDEVADAEPHELDLSSDRSDEST